MYYEHFVGIKADIYSLRKAHNTEKIAIRRFTQKRFIAIEFGWVAAKFIVGGRNGVIRQ